MTITNYVQNPVANPPCAPQAMDKSMSWQSTALLITGIAIITLAALAAITGIALCFVFIPYIPLVLQISVLIIGLTGLIICGGAGIIRGAFSEDLEKRRIALLPNHPDASVPPK